MKLYYHPVSTTSRPVVLFATLATIATAGISRVRPWVTDFSRPTRICS